MPYVKADDGRLVKVACWPCIRGHRSSTCGEKHRDRVLVEVRKPGRPMTSCPHPRSAKCNCSASVAYTIPKGATCTSSSGESSNARHQPILAAANKPTFEVKPTPATSAWPNKVTKPASRNGPKRTLTEDSIETALKREEERAIKEEEDSVSEPDTRSGGCCGSRAVRPDESSPPTAGTDSPPFPCGQFALDQLASPTSVISGFSQQLSLHNSQNNGMDVNGLPSNCNCGDDCVCLGCAAHPRNATTADYVRKAIEFQKHHVVDCPLPESDPSFASWNGWAATGTPPTSHVPTLDANATFYPQPTADFHPSMHDASLSVGAIPSNDLLATLPPISTNGAFLPRGSFSYQELVIPCPNTDGTCCCMSCSCQGCMTHTGCEFLNSTAAAAPGTACIDYGCPVFPTDSGTASMMPTANSSPSGTTAAQHAAYRHHHHHPSVEFATHSPFDPPLPAPYMTMLPQGVLQ